MRAPARGRTRTSAERATVPRDVTLFAAYGPTVDDWNVAKLTMMLTRGAVVTGLPVRGHVRGTLPTIADIAVPPR